MPHSVFTGRALPGPGEPLFTDEDTAGAIALAEEEKDTCPSCGYPKAWCRAAGPDDVEKVFARFEVHESTCHATRVLAERREAKAKDKKVPASQLQALQLTPRIRKGQTPDVAGDLGIDLDLDGSDVG